MHFVENSEHIKTFFFKFQFQPFIVATCPFFIQPIEIKEQVIIFFSDKLEIINDSKRYNK